MCGQTATACWATPCCIRQYHGLARRVFVTRRIPGFRMSRRKFTLSIRQSFHHTSTSETVLIHPYHLPCTFFPFLFIHRTLALLVPLSLSLGANHQSLEWFSCDDWYPPYGSCGITCMIPSVVARHIDHTMSLGVVTSLAMH